MASNDESELENLDLSGLGAIDAARQALRAAKERKARIEAERTGEPGDEPESQAEAPSRPKAPASQRPPSGNKRRPPQPMIHEEPKPESPSGAPTAADYAAAAAVESGSPGEGGRPVPAQAQRKPPRRPGSGPGRRPPQSGVQRRPGQGPGPGARRPPPRGTSERVPPPRGTSERVAPPRGTSERVAPPPRGTSERVAPPRGTSERVAPPRGTSERVPAGPNRGPGPKRPPVKGPEKAPLAKGPRPGPGNQRPNPKPVPRQKPAPSQPPKKKPQPQRSGGVVQRVQSSWPPAPAKKKPAAPQPGAKPAAKAKSKNDELAKLGVSLPKLAKRKKLRNFSDLGWACAEPSGNGSVGTEVVALDLGVEGLSITRFEGSFNKPKDMSQPTMVMVKDAHAFRTLEPFSLDVGLPAAERWPSERVLRGTHGSIMLPSQIGLVEFPGDHVLAGLISKVRDENDKDPRQLVLTLPTFLPSKRGKAIRDVAAPYRKGSFAGVPGAIAAAYFYLAPGVGRIKDPGQELVEWSAEAFAKGRVLILDWGASGLAYGLVSIREGKDDGKSELRLMLAGTWPSLGGHRLTLRIAMALRDLIVQRILEEGASDDLVPLALLKPHMGEVPRPFGYDEGLRALRRMGKPRNDLERAERAQLRNLIFPTKWKFEAGEEPVGYAPYRRLAVLHFNALWKAAERIKRLILSDPPRYLKRKTIPWAIQLDSPFVSHLSRSIDYPVAHLLTPVEKSLDACMRHIQGRLDRRQISAPLHIGVAGMQSGGSLLHDGIQRLTSRRDSGALRDAKIAPTSSDPRELKSLVNRGAALLNRDKKNLDFGPIPDVLPFDVQIADATQNITIFSAGPLDELVVFQRRVRVEEGFPQYEFILFSSEDESQAGSWGAINFHEPFEFTASDRSIAVDPRYGFGSGLPLLRNLKGDDGKGLTKCYDRTTRGWNNGRISFRGYAPRESDAARRLLHFLEYGLFGNFHRKVFLLEREFQKPPKRFDFIYQRYYLSRSQELLVVREWWAPTEDGKLMRNKTLHTCQGSTEANRILGLSWGTY